MYVYVLIREHYDEGDENRWAMTTEHIEGVFRSVQDAIEASEHGPWVIWDYTDTTGEVAYSDGHWPKDNWHIERHCLT